MQVTYKLLTNPGDRSNNEDYLGMAEEDGEFFFAVADGLGGHDKGEVASELVVTTTMEQFYQRETEEFLGEAMEKAQNALMEKQQAEHAFGKMKTTYTGLYLRENMAQWGHVGDSRVYYFDRHHMKKRTLDHSVPQMLVASGEIKEKEIRYHPDRNHLLRVMGTEWEQPRYELTPFMKLKKRRQAFLLCTDGFWELITEKEMEQCLKKAANVEDWIVSMEALVKEHGQDIDMDNYTAIGVFVE